MVVEYVEGERERAPSDETEYIRQLAAVVAEMHQIDLATAEVSSLPERSIDIPTGVPATADERRVRDALESARPFVAQALEKLSLR